MNYDLDRNLTKHSVKLDDGVFEYTVMSTEQHVKINSVSLWQHMVTEDQEFH